MSEAAPIYRYLRGYTLDPGFSTRLDTAAINEGIYRIPFESVEPGPIGQSIEVIDYDPASDCWYDPVNLAAENIASQNGLRPSEGNPQFHQQFVYAVTMKTIRHFEYALGRKIVWASRQQKRDGHPKYLAKLRIYPHAIRDANAYYDPEKTAVLFGYFAASEQSQGTNYPGGIVFTCLSPDIVAHEITHAILDSIHQHYIENTNLDVPAFHEGFADIVALLQRFTFVELVEHQLSSTGGRLDRYTVLGELATQFGQALKGNHGALRSMIGEWKDKDTWTPLTPKPSDYANSVECHSRGAVLVATIFDAFQRIYKFRTRDLFVIANDGASSTQPGRMTREFVHRLAREAGEIAEHLLHICIRALDYCPPIDITFGDFFRALITADRDIAPEDENGYRLALIEAFRARGIFPDRVSTLSVESLSWDRPVFLNYEERAISKLADIFDDRFRKLMHTTSSEDLFNESAGIQSDLRRLFNRRSSNKKNPFNELSPKQWETFLNKLGMTSSDVGEIFYEDSKNVRFMRRVGKNRFEADSDYVPEIEVDEVRPAFRAGREGRQVDQILITLSQRITANIGVGDQVNLMEFCGGCSLILNLSSLNKVEYVIVKTIRNYTRFCDQQRHLECAGANLSMSADSLYGDSRDWQLRFNLIHQH